jgi:pimeloyl-ACP methyl ester carboxylesterase
MMSSTTSARDSYGGSISQVDAPPFVVEELPGKISLLVVGSGPPLVLFPGLSRDSRQLTAQFAARRARGYRGLARVTGRTVYLVNRPRDLPPKLKMPDLATAHADALRSHFAEPVDIMGVSTGGAIALQLAVDHAKVVRRLIVACAASSLGDWGRQQLALYGSLIGQGKSGDTGQIAISLAHGFRNLDRRVAGA